MRKIFLLLFILVMLNACGNDNISNNADITTNQPTNDIGTILSAQQLSVAGRVYLGTAENGIIIINDGGNGSKYERTPMTTDQTPVITTGYNTSSITWSLNGHNLALASHSDQEFLKVSDDSTTLTNLQNPVATYTVAKPFSVSSLNGKHLAETFKEGSYCTARTLSFTANTLTVREQCGRNFNELPLMLEDVDGVENLLHAYSISDNHHISVYLALRDGLLEGQSTVVVRAEGFPQTGTTSFDTLLDMMLTKYQSQQMQVSNFTAVASPLTEAISPDLSVATVATRTGCDLFNTHKFTCPSDDYLKDLDIDSCVFTPSLWLIKTAAIACLTDKDKLAVNYSSDYKNIRKYSRVYGFSHDGGANSIGAIE